MNLRPSPTAMLAAGAIALVAIVLVIKKKAAALTPGNVAAGAVGVVSDVAVGTVLGVGDVLGIPRTNETECQAAIREGRTLDASFVCPAGTFISSIFSPSTPVPSPTPTPAPAATESRGIGDITYDPMGNPIY